MVLGEAAGGVAFDRLTGLKRLRSRSGHDPGLLKAACRTGSQHSHSDWIHLSD